VTEATLVVQITRAEATHLSGLVDQFIDLVRGDTVDSDDPAVGRLVPDAYPDDPEAAQEFRAITERDLLERRLHDAEEVRESLAPAATLDSLRDSGTAGWEEVELALAPATVRAWLRTLAAIRLVLATRLEITDEDDGDDADPRFGVYEWLGYRLEGLIQAIDRG
jgi:hypothetical protein